MKLLSCENLTLGYEGTKVVEELNLSVSSGDYLCIVGENGSGKTTLMKTILGLQAPLSGQVLTGSALRREEIGYLPQQTQVQRDFPASVFEVVLSGCLNKNRWRPFYTKQQRLQAKLNIQKLGLENISSRCYRDLSGGQQQRTLLARALCAADKLLLLDEPASGLDPQITDEFYELIVRLNREGMTIIMVSHDMKASLMYASHILHVAKTPLFWGRKEDYLLSDIGHYYAMREEAKQ